MDRLLARFSLQRLAAGEAAMKMKTKSLASLAVVGVDIGKEAFHLAGLGTLERSPFAGRSGG